MTHTERTQALKRLAIQPEWAAVEEVFNQLDAQAVDALRQQVDEGANMFLIALGHVRRALQEYIEPTPETEE